MYWGFVCNDCIFANFENPALLKKVCTIAATQNTAAPTSANTIKLFAHEGYK